MCQFAEPFILVHFDYVILLKFGGPIAALLLLYSFNNLIKQYSNL